MDCQTVCAEQFLDLRSPAVTDSNPDDLWRGAFQNASFSEIGVLRHNDISACSGEVPNLPVIAAFESKTDNVFRIWIQVDKIPHQLS